MAASISLKYPFSVEWLAKLPFKDRPSRSPNITVLGGTQFYLELRWQRESYSLLICVKNECEVLQKFGVTTFIRDPLDFQSTLYASVPTISFRNYVIWSKIRSDILALMPNFFTIGEFAVICVFHSTDTHLYKNPSGQVSTQTTLSIVDLQSLSRDFYTFLKDETLSDVKLKCASHTFSANRSVLAARSEVFAAMFRNKMAENVSGVVHIKGMDPEVLELLLEYMYSAEKPDLREETVHCVYEAADKYAVHGLRRACSDWMVEHQTTDNCLDLLVLADKHSDKHFKDAVACFVAEHLADLSVESWSTFNDNYPLLVLSVLKKHCEDLMPGAAKRAKY